MKSITIHGIDERLERSLKEKAAKNQKSMNKTIKGVLEEVLGLKPGKKSDHRGDFIDLFGVWTKKDKKEFDDAVKDCRKIDKEDWK